MTGDGAATGGGVTGDGGVPVSRRAVLGGALAGLVLIAPISVAQAVVRREVDDFDDSAWLAVFTVLVLAAFFVAGVRAGRLGPAGPLTNGMLAALSTVVLWIPVRIVVWLVREGDRGLVSGDDPVLRVGQLFVTAVFALALGALGGRVGARGAPRAAAPE